MRATLFCLGLIFSLLHSPFICRADATSSPESAVPLPPPMPAQNEEDESVHLEFSTYGVVNATRYDFFRNAQDRNPFKRTRTDLERVVFEPELEFRPNIKLETEIEFEHGGTGSSFEYDTREDGGEFEKEQEAGGEVIVEKLMLQVEQTDWLSYRAGLITVPVGLIATRHHPTEYFSTTRNRSESRILPSTWRSVGVSVYGTPLRRVFYEAGLVQGMNSEQFTSYGWVAEGQKRKFESANADGLAGVVRLDYGQHIPERLVGASFYQGDVARNRFRPDQVEGEAMLRVWDIHGVWDSDTWTFRALYVQGSLENADKITRANSVLPSPSPGDSHFTTIGSASEAYFLEAGYNVGQLLKLRHRLDLFGRYDVVDPMKEVKDGTRNPRFEEKSWTAGLNYRLHKSIVIKGEFTEIKSGADYLPTTHEVAVGFGYFYSTEQ